MYWVVRNEAENLKADLLKNQSAKFNAEPVLVLTEKLTNPVEGLANSYAENGEDLFQLYIESDGELETLSLEPFRDLYGATRLPKNRVTIVTRSEVHKYPQIAAEFERRIQKAQQDARQFFYGDFPIAIVIGRITTGNQKKDREIFSQERILPGGFFVLPVQDPSKSVEFLCEDYLPYRLVPAMISQPAAGRIYDVGLLEMQRVPPDAYGKATGQIRLEGKLPVTRSRIQLRTTRSTVNSPSGQTEGGASDQTPTRVRVSQDGSFETPKLGPGTYHLEVNCPNHVDFYTQFRIVRGRQIKVPAISLDAQKDVVIEYFVKNFKDQRFSPRKLTQTIKTGGSFKSRSNLEGSDFLLSTRNGELQFGQDWAGGSVEDLGEGAIEDFVDFDTNDHKASYILGVTPKIGHCYILKHSAFKHYILFKNVSVDGKDR